MNETTVEVKLRPLSSVEVKEVAWLWEPYVPFGKISILEGDPSTAKTFLSLTLAASVTTGRGFGLFGLTSEEL